MVEGEWVWAKYVKALLSNPSGLQESEALLRRAGIPPESLDGKQARVGVKDYQRLIDTLIHRFRDESFGFTEQGLKLGSFALMCQSMWPGPTLGDALRSAALFYRMITMIFGCGCMKPMTKRAGTCV